jgi:hypothetical protein
MSTHFPECINDGGSCCPWMGDCTCQCICDILRACEERVTKQNETNIFDLYDAEYENGYEDGINAAIIAVQELMNKPGAHGEHYLSAINHLRSSS